MEYEFKINLPTGNIKRDDIIFGNFRKFKTG